MGRQGRSGRCKPGARRSTVTADRTPLTPCPAPGRMRLVLEDIESELYSSTEKPGFAFGPLDEG